MRIIFLVVVGILLLADIYLFCFNSYINSDTYLSAHLIPLPVDDVPPTVTINGGDDINVALGTTFEDDGVTAYDDRTDVTVDINGEVDTNTVGEYSIEYIVTDEHGNSTTVTRKVNVLEPTGVIYLTFDDGPGAYTSALLDVLAKHNVKATFFVTCDQPEYFRCVARACKAGHTIGIHSASHVYSEIYAGEEAFFEDFQKVRAMIFNQTGEYPTICRFPGGSSNTVSEFNPGIMTRLASDVRDLGYQYFDWDVYSGDAGGKGATTKSDTVFANVTEGIGDRHTAIILQHDIKGFSVDAVEEIILWGLENGYAFRPLDAGSPPAHFDIAN